MFTLSYATKVNPDGAEPKLTAEQVWRGLELKAENAMPFVPIMTKCEVVSRDETTITRDIVIAGKDAHREFITLQKPVQVIFQRMDGTGLIYNTISESEVGLLLTFTFGVTFPGIAPNSPQEREEGAKMRGAYVGAVEATLRRVREMVRAGEL